jgi:hypothetical protein
MLSGLSNELQSSDGIEISAAELRSSRRRLLRDLE